MTGDSWLDIELIIYPMLPSSLITLIRQLNKFPGIGPKTAERLAWWLIKQQQGQLNELAEAIKNSKENLKFCQSCLAVSSQNPCSICSNANRDKKIVCVVAETSNLTSIEKLQTYNGLYFVLGILLDPLEGITSEQLPLKQLKDRINQNGISEIILALNPDLAGETTTLFLQNWFKEFPHVTISKLARGLPIGSSLEYTDEATLLNALNNRQKI